MMKINSLLVLMACVAITAGSTFAATVYPTQSGNWTDPATWAPGAVPANTSADEYKLVYAASTAGNDLVLTINSNVGDYTAAKFDIARATTLQVQDGAYIGIAKELRVGDAGCTGNGGTQSDDGFLNQTGGQINILSGGKLGVGWKLFASGTVGGVHTISGGSITGAGQLIVGGYGAAGSVGKLDIVGAASTINVGALYISNSTSTGTNAGTGTVQFDIDAAGAVTKIQAASVTLDAVNAAAAVANLVVTDATAAVPADVIVLIENTGTNSVTGLFDTLNGGSAAEGASVVLGGKTYNLTYVYAAGSDAIGNDIALVAPEPATIAVLGLGGLLLRRRLA